MKGIVAFLKGKWLEERSMFVQAPFILFIAGLCVMYIWNSYYMEKLVIRNNKAETHLRDLRAEYNSVKTKLNKISRQSEVAQELRSDGMKELTEPPYRIDLNE